jgi:NAD(P)H-nitrite reductase large subunit
MVADDTAEEFRWVSSYSITHFEFPFLSFGHPTLGDDSVERKYSETEWRRVALKDGRVVGGVLIGDLSPQSKLKQLAREQRDVSGQEEVLLAETIDLDELDASPAEVE